MDTNPPPTPHVLPGEGRPATRGHALRKPGTYIRTELYLPRNCFFTGRRRSGQVQRLLEAGSPGSGSCFPVFRGLAGGGGLQQVAEPNRPQPESRAVGAASRSAVWGASRGVARPRHVDTALQCPPSRPGLASRRGRLSATLKTEPAVPGSTALWVWTSWPGGSQHPKRGFNGRVGVFWTCRKGHLGREQLRPRPRGREGLRRCGAHRGARGHPLSRPPLRRLHWPSSRHLADLAELTILRWQGRLCSLLFLHLKYQLKSGRAKAGRGNILRPTSLPLRGCRARAPKDKCALSRSLRQV